MTQPPYDDPKVQNLRRAASLHLLDIADLFNTPVRLALIVRNPDFPDGSRDVYISDDDPDAVIAAIRQLTTVGVPSA